MIGIAHAFSPSYAQARTRFLEAAAAAGLPIESHAHPLKGRDGEDLAMDVVRDGRRVADLFLTGPTNIVCKGEATDEDCRFCAAEH